MRRLTLFALAALAGCAASPKAESAAAVTPVVRSPTVAAGLDRVIGQPARALTTLFGTPAQDFADGGARKLQFEGTACVLDAYLYPKRAGGEPVVTHIDARRPEGQDQDRAACIAALAVRRP